MGVTQLFTGTSVPSSGNEVMKCLLVKELRLRLQLDLRLVQSPTQGTGSCYADIQGKQYLQIHLRYKNDYSQNCLWLLHMMKMY